MRRLKVGISYKKSGCQYIIRFAAENEFLFGFGEYYVNDSGVFERTRFYSLKFRFAVLTYVEGDFGKFASSVRDSCKCGRTDRSYRVRNGYRSERRFEERAVADRRKSVGKAYAL